MSVLNVALSSPLTESVIYSSCDLQTYSDCMHLNFVVISLRSAVIVT